MTILDHLRMTTAKLKREVDAPGSLGSAGRLAKLKLLAKLTETERLLAGKHNLNKI